MTFLIVMSMMPNIEPFLFTGGAGIAAILMMFFAEISTRRIEKKVKVKFHKEDENIKNIENFIELALNSKNLFEFNLFKEAALAKAMETDPRLLIIYDLMPYDIEEKLKDWSWIH